MLSEKTLFLGQKLTVIQGDIAQLTVDAVVHPTNGNFSLAGQCGQSHTHTLMNKMAKYITHAGSALRSGGGPTFDSAVKEVSDKTSLAMCEGTPTPPLPLYLSLSIYCSCYQWVWEPVAMQTRGSRPQSLLGR